VSRHSERSEESLFFVGLHTEGFLASLGMTFQTVILVFIRGVANQFTTIGC